MKNLNYLVFFTAVSAIATTVAIPFANPVLAANSLKVTCDLQQSVPTVTATFYNHESMQVTPILAFLPQYFNAETANFKCQETAQKLDGFYTQDQMKYLASDTIAQKPVVCAVARRGVGCDSYNSEILFSLAQPVNPTKLLYNMLGDDFKGSQPPSSRTVSRIYTDLRPMWWPFR